MPQAVCTRLGGLPVVSIGAERAQIEARCSVKQQAPRSRTYFGRVVCPSAQQRNCHRAPAATTAAACGNPFLHPFLLHAPQPLPTPCPRVYCRLPRARSGHQGERAARRNLRVIPYRPIACPYAKKKLPCPDGDQVRSWSFVLGAVASMPSAQKLHACALWQRVGR